MSYLKQRQNTIFRQGGSPSSLLQERPGPFDPQEGKEAISTDSCALLRATARRRVPVYQRSIFTQQGAHGKIHADRVTPGAPADAAVIPKRQSAMNTPTMQTHSRTDDSNRWH